MRQGVILTFLFGAALCMVTLCGCDAGMKGATKSKKRSPKEQEAIKFARNEVKKILKFPTETKFFDDETVITDPEELCIYGGDQRAVYGNVQEPGKEPSSYIVVLSMSEDNTIEMFNVFYRGYLVASWGGGVGLAKFRLNTVKKWKQSIPEYQKTLVMDSIVVCADGRIDREWRETILPKATQKTMEHLNGASEYDEKTVFEAVQEVCNNYL